jgi:hypothetical protein
VFGVNDVFWRVWQVSRRVVKIVAVWGQGRAAPEAGISAIACAWG